MIKETTQGSKKKVYGPYKGKRIKLKKPRMVKFKGTNKPVPIRYETKIYKVKTKKNTQKGGTTNAQTYRNSLSNHWRYRTRELAKMPGYDNVVIGFNFYQGLLRRVQDQSSFEEAKSKVDQYFTAFIEKDQTKKKK